MSYTIKLVDNPRDNKTIHVDNTQTLFQLLRLAQRDKDEVKYMRAGDTVVVGQWSVRKHD